jgi:hypothetical protein
MDVNDRMAGAIQEYAQTLPNPEFKLNLLAAAEHMAPALIHLLGLKQEWALLDFEKLLTRESDSAPIVEVEKLERIRCDSENIAQVYDELEYQRGDRGGLEDEYTRTAVGSRLFTDYAEEHPIILNEDEQRQMDIDQGVVPNVSGL